MDNTTKIDTAKLANMKLNELQAEFAAVTGEPTKCPNKKFLIRRISECLQGAEDERNAKIIETEVEAEIEAKAEIEAIADTEAKEETEVKAETEAEAEASAIETDEATDMAVPTTEEPAQAPSAIEPIIEPIKKKLSQMEVPELQARYLEVVGRPTGSVAKSYLIWKIREARKGRIPVGPRKNIHKKDVEFKVLPLRMETELIAQLDEAWKRNGLNSRTELFRKSLQSYLIGIGESELAARFGSETV